MTCSAVKKSLFFNPLFIRESIVFILTVLFFGYFSFLGFDLHHDGVMLFPAVRVAEGGVVFRDVFCQYGLLVPLLQGLAVALFGAEMVVIRLLTVLFYGGSAVLLDLLWKRFLPQKLSIFTPVMFLVYAPCIMVTFHSWSSVYALFFMLLYALFMVRYFEKDSSSLLELFLAGISAGLVWSCRAPCGAVTVFAAILVLLGLNWFCGKGKKTVWAESGCFFAGTLVVALLAFGYIILLGAWSDFVLQNFTYVADFAYSRGSNGSWQYFCDSLFPFYQEDLAYFNSLFALMPLCAMIILYVRVRNGILDGKDQMRRFMPLAALLILGLGSWHQYYPVPCVRHLFWGGAPLFGAYLLALSELWKKRSLIRVALCILMIFVALITLIPRVIGISKRLDLHKRPTVDVPSVRHLRLTRHEENLVKILCGLETQGKAVGLSKIVNWTEDSLITFMLAPSGFEDTQFYRIANSPYRDYDNKIFKYISENPSMVLLDHDTFIPGFVKYAEFEYIGKNYYLFVPSR